MKIADIKAIVYGIILVGWELFTTQLFPGFKYATEVLVIIFYIGIILMISSEGIPIKCQGCSYGWNYTGYKHEGQKISCPGCGRKVRIP